MKASFNTSKDRTEIALFTPLYTRAKETEQSDREQLRFGAITNTVIRKIENPSLSAKAVDKVPNTITIGADRWVYSPARKRETPTRVCTNKGRGKNRYAKQWARLSHHDKQDIDGAVAFVLIRHNLISPGGWVIGKIPNPVWIEIFSEARKSCRIDRKHERNAISFQALATADFLQVETRENAYLTQDRSAIARYAMIYRNALKAARDAQKAKGNRKWDFSYKTNRTFLHSSLKSSLNGEGWGGLITEQDTQQHAKEYRANKLRSFREYILLGLSINHPDFFPSQDTNESPVPREFKTFDSLPSLVEMIAAQS